MPSPPNCGISMHCSLYILITFMLMHRNFQKSGNLEVYQTARLSRLPNLDDEILSIYGFTLR